MSNKLKEVDWDLLLRRIKDGKCTPFLGSGICSEKIPLNQISNEWAEKYGYPMGDTDNLTRVAQFVGVTVDHMTPKEEMRKKTKKLLDEFPPEYFKDPNELYEVLADLPLPVYITTNFDDLMERALISRDKKPNQEICQWYIKQSKQTSSEDYVPTKEHPILYHLHGSYEIPESLVLTEEDYLEFLVAVSKKQDLIIPRIQEAFTDTSLLILGYKIGDWDFRVLFRILTDYSKRRTRKSLSVQLVPMDVPDAQKEKAQEYLDCYFDKLDIQVYWQDCRQFAIELRERWEAFNRGN